MIGLAAGYEEAILLCWGIPLIDVLFPCDTDEIGACGFEVGY
jgi:hypothetical protein